jgi:ketosteroid isomerase-like protein
MSVEDEIRQVSDRFYAAVNRIHNGDSEPMMEVWSQSSDVTVTHPFGGRQMGWDEVRASWEQTAQLRLGGHTTLRDQLIRVGSDMAYEVGSEFSEGTIAGQPLRADVRVTNIYRREAGGWKMVHHHTDAAPAAQEVLSRLQPAPE